MHATALAAALAVLVALIVLYTLRSPLDLDGRFREHFDWLVGTNVRSLFAMPFEVVGPLAIAVTATFSSWRYRARKRSAHR